jgi:hypothetical protein
VKKPQRVFVLALVVALATWAAWQLAAAGSHGAQPLGWRGGGVARGAALSLPYPARWHGVSVDQGIAVASFPLTREWLDAQRRSVPEGGVYIQVFTYGRLPKEYDEGFPPRPDLLELDPQTFGFYECSLRLEGYIIRFRENGLAVQVEVALGPEADPALAGAVMNRLRVS